MADAEIDTTGLVADMGRRARIAAQLLAMLSSAAKCRALEAAAETIREAEPEILAANAIGKPREHQRAIEQVRQQPLRDHEERKVDH